MKLIIGLGNPGPEYARTRHNVGFEVIDRLARRFVDASSACAKARFDALSLEGQIGSERVLLLKPTTFMNRCGRCVAQAVGFFKLDAAKDLLVVADDLDLPCGSIRVRAEGGAGGHNGLSDILSALGSPVWARCRIGIDRQGQIPQAEYVLGRFTPEQQPLVESGIEQACDAAALWCTSTVEATMNRFNRTIPAESKAAPSN